MGQKTRNQGFSYYFCMMIRIRILLFSSLTFKMPTKNNFFKQFFVPIFFKAHVHHFSMIKSQKESQKNSRNQGFSYYFCMMIKGSGSIPLTNGSGSRSRRPKNMWIRIRIRIRNTDTKLKFMSRILEIIHVGSAGSGSETN